VPADGDGADREDGSDRSGRDDAAARDEGSQHERVIRSSAEPRGDRRRESTGDRARKERGRGAKRDLLTEARGTPRRHGRIRQEGGTRRARDDAAEANEHRRQEERYEGVEDEYPEDAEAGDRAAQEDGGTARAPPREDSGGDSAGDDADRLRPSEQAYREFIEAKGPVEKVQIEGGDAQPEAAQSRRDQIEDGVAPSERCRYFVPAQPGAAGRSGTTK